MRLLGVAVLAAGFVMSSPAMAQQTGGSEVTGPQHALVVLEMGPNGSELVYARVVDMPLPRARVGSWTVETLDAAGNVLYAATLADPSWLRGEFGGDPADNVHVRLETVTVTLRMPIDASASRVRVLAPAAELPQGDLRAAGLPPGETVEVGSIALPEVVR